MFCIERRSERARAQVALGLRIAQDRDMLGVNSLAGLGPNDRARRQEIVWSLFMLDRMLLGGNTWNPSSPITAFECPVLTTSPLHPDAVTQPSDDDVSLIDLHAGVPKLEHSIMCLQIQSIHLWEKVVAEIARPPSSSDVPLWRHDSPRAAILTQLLDCEMSELVLSPYEAQLIKGPGCEVAGHSLLNTGPPNRVLEEPHLAGYFLVWLRFQLSLCVINCCLYVPPKFVRL